MQLLSIEGVAKGFNDRVLFEDVSLAVAEGERIGLLGRNGSGKSTLLRILAGLEPPDAGQRVARRGLRLGYLEQNPALDPDSTLREATRAGLARHVELLAELERAHAALAGAGDEDTRRILARQAALEAELEQLGGYDVEHRIESTLHALGLPAVDARCGTLSGGERRRVALARLLLGEPELLLLDEPTNHLDAFVTEWLEDWFLEHRIPMLLVTHDRYFLDRLVDRIVELDRSRLFSYAGGYGEYLEARAERLAVERSDERARLNDLRRETAWMRRGAPARTTKAKARIRRHEELVAAAPARAPSELVFEIPPGPRLGTRVLKVTGVKKRYGQRWVVPPLDLELEAGTRLGVVGPNGAGKTTLVKLLLGELEPDGGRREVGETVRFMSIDQLRGGLDPAKSVAETVVGRGDVVRVGERDVRAEAYLDRFGFPASAHRTPVGRLSGGEQSRVLLAKLLLAGGNVLFLDEPTNDLDLETLRALEEALLAFPGAAVVVSHDRWFLDRVATRILYLDGEGGARVHFGDCSSLLQRLAEERTAAPPATPAPRPAAPAPGVTPRRPKRLTPWQEKELAELEARIGRIEGEIAALDGRLADPALYAGPRAEVARVREARATLAGELARAYERWEELEGLRA